MKIGVAATGGSLDAQVAGQFGRCAYFVVVDPQTLKFEAFTNPASGMAGGAGPAAVQALVRKGVQVVLAGTFGPKAEEALRLARIRYAEAKGKVRDAVSQYSQGSHKEGRLETDIGMDL